jgi:hypothetical protein
MAKTADERKFYEPKTGKVFKDGEKQIKLEKK